MLFNLRRCNRQPCDSLKNRGEQCTSLSDSLPDQNEVEITDVTLQEPEVSAEHNLSALPCRHRLPTCFMRLEMVNRKESGPVINSRNFDLGGDITADGRTLLFCSVRNASPPGNRD
ncbi:MAG TPA: hypothetical protein DCM07_20000 [Planctomycetaceae bacterium]|nr:hypothetical protein [Gimesia sp.]HAH47091.1 hypothetical protein [Planctomycetaceae bacterium]HBL48143.1 hypothetical protein [Planctomycetaceae bacterium]